MKKFFIISALYLFAGCSDTGNTNTGTGRDSGNNSSPVSGDTVTHPSGVDNSAVISTDTAAINVQNTIKKADSLKKQNK